jgi:hypothetical protein
MGVGLYLKGRCTGKEPPPPKALLERVEHWARKNCGVAPHDYHSAAGKDRDGKPTLLLRFHPAGGQLEVTALGKGQMCASAKTSPVGPGYHAYLCDLLKRLGAALHVAWEPDEEAGEATRFFFTGDRAALELEFLRWLKECAQIAHDNVRAGGGWYLSMPIGHQYECHGQAVTPMGYRDAAWLAAVAKDPSAGTDVFPWWNEGRGPEYDLNRALHLMWTEVRWRKPINSDEARLYELVLALLQDAHADAPNLDYPWREWREMDRYVEGVLGDEETLSRDLRNDIARRATAVKKKLLIGYRRHPVRVDLPEAWWLTVPGSFAEGWEDGGRTWSAWDNVCSVWVTTYTFLNKDGTPLSAEETLAQSRDRAGERLDYRGDKVIGRAFLEHVTKDEEDEGEKTFWRLCGRSAAAGHLAGFAICYTDPAYREWAIDTWHTIQHA